MPAAIAPFWTAGRGGAHTYWLNTYDLPSRSLYNLTALTLHESAPGHSFQGSLVEEQKAVPDFRHEYISAYGEGWALYCEKLGKEMGIYQTPYDDFGRLTYEMWRAARLVIDTGVHHKGWTRAAGDRLSRRPHRAEPARSRDRGRPLHFLAGPGAVVQARRDQDRRAARAGGKGTRRRSSISASSTTRVLEIGSVPLPVLEEHIKAFIAEQKTKTEKS